MTVQIEGQVEVYFMDSDTDGDFQAIALPAGVDCKGYGIQVHDNSATSFHPDDTAKPFHYAHEDGGDYIAFNEYGLFTATGKKGGSTVGYVRAESGNKVALLVVLDRWFYRE